MNRTFGQRVGYFRRRLGLSQEALAERSDLSRNFIGLLETGGREPSLHSALRIQRALGLKLWELFPSAPEPRGGIREEDVFYGRLESKNPTLSPQYRRVVRKLFRCTPEEQKLVASLVFQLVKLRRQASKPKSAKSAKS